MGFGAIAAKAPLHISCMYQLQNRLSHFLVFVSISSSCFNLHIQNGLTKRKPLRSEIRKSKVFWEKISRVLEFEVFITFGQIKQIALAFKLTENDTITFCFLETRWEANYKGARS